MAINSAVPSVAATFIRGGTSKAVFFHEKDLPPPGPTRDQLLIRVMGSPDPTQIDGMGGARIVTSKIAIVSPSARLDADVDYTFCQVSLGEASINYDANCGNISSGVGPFAINEGLIKQQNWKEGRRIVRIYNTGTDSILIAHVPVDPKTNRALERGDYAIDGCPGTGAPILMDYSQTAKRSAMLPTGHVIDQLNCTFGKVEATFCEVGNPIIFVEAEMLMIDGNEDVAAIDANKDLIGRVKEIRGRMAQQLGKCADWSKVDEQSPMLPLVALVSKATSKEGNIQSRLFLDNRCHPSMAATGGICTTALSRIKGSVVNRLLSPGSLKSDTLSIQHPAGYLPIRVHSTESADDEFPSFAILGFMRTARYIMQGQIFIPADVQDSIVEPKQATAERISVAGQAQDEQTINHPAKDFKTETPPERPAKVTEALVDFTQTTTFDDLNPDVQERLRQCLLDFFGVASLGAMIGESSPVFLKAIDAMTVTSSGKTMVIGSDRRLPTEYAAMLNGAFAHTLDFDDTHMIGIIHVAATIVATLVAESESHPDLSYKEMIIAMAVGYEVALRISNALGVSCWHRGFHNTSIAGIFGAVAVLSKLRHLDTKTIANAFGLTVSFASGSMQYLSNGSWNKRLHPGKAAHDSFLIIALAQAGTLGAAEPIEGKFGLVNAHTDPPAAQVNVAGLGKTWELLLVGLKPYSACRVTHTSIELATLLSEGQAPPVKSIHIVMDPANYPIVADPTPVKIHPKNIVDAQFSVYYQTAAAWLYGDQQGWAIYDHMRDRNVQELCSKITIESKVLDKTNNLVTSMTATLENGEVREMTLQHPRWEQPKRPAKHEEVVTKFRSLTVGSLGQDKVNKVVDFVYGPLDARVSRLLSLLSSESSE